MKQDEIVTEYCKEFGIPYVIVRPGYVYGPGSRGITARVGTGTFGVFLHLGGSNRIPFTYVDNCADAIVLAGLKDGVDGEMFNVVDDDLPSSRQFLRLYKRNVRQFRSLYVPHAVSYLLCYLWERYSIWSEGQLPLSFNRKTWHSFWKKTHFSNAKLKTQVGWAPKVPMAEGFRRYFESCRSEENMLKVAIVGCGKIADAHVSQIQRIKGCEIVGVCDQEPLMARQLYERFAVNRYFCDLTELLSDTRPDVVHITTPPESHFAIATLCLEQGCHVYVEKPFTLCEDEAQRLISLAQRERAQDHCRDTIFNSAMWHDACEL